MLSLVLAVTGKDDALLRTMSTLMRTADTLRDRSEQVELTLLDCTGDETVENTLRSIEGATVLAGPPFNPAAAWWNGVELAKGDSVWLGLSDGPVDSEELLDMYERTSGGQHVAVSAASSGDHAMYRTDALDASGGLYPLLSGRTDPRDLLRAAAEATEDVAVVLHKTEDVEVVSHADRIITEAQALSPGFSGATIQVTHPDSFSAGLFSYAGQRTTIISWTATAPIRIGKYCSISGEVKLLNAGSTSDDVYDLEGNPAPGYLTRGAHRAHSATSFPLGILLPEAPYRDPPHDGSIIHGVLDIGHDVWVGYGATVFGPVKIGNGAQIGVGAVVINDVPPYSIVVGNPAKVVRMRFSKEVVERLQRLAWWDWPADKVLENWEWFTKPINEFLDHFDS